MRAYPLSAPHPEARNGRDAESTNCRNLPQPGCGRCHEFTLFNSLAYIKCRKCRKSRKGSPFQSGPDPEIAQKHAFGYREITLRRRHVRRAPSGSSVASINGLTRMEKS